MLLSGENTTLGSDIKEEGSRSEGMFPLIWLLKVSSIALALLRPDRCFHQNPQGEYIFEGSGLLHSSTSKQEVHRSHDFP